MIPAPAIEKPFVSVIIPVYHDWHGLEGCLRALAAQTLPASRFEILVANNDPQDPPRIPDPPPNLTVIPEARPGSYAARNAAVRVARGDVLAFTDADCLPEPHWLEAGALTAWREQTRVAGQVDFFWSGASPTMAELLDVALHLDQPRMARLGKAATANMFALRSHFDTVGLFNDQRLSGGDMEWGRRAANSQIGILFVPEAVVRHPARQTLGGVLRKRRRVLGGSVEKFRKKPWHYILVSPVRALLPATRKVFATQRRLRLGPAAFAKLFLAAWLTKLHDAVVTALLASGRLRPSRS